MVRIISGILILICAGYVIGTLNKVTKLHNQYEAQRKKIEVTHDTMWKTIQQATNIDEKYREDIKTIASMYSDRTALALSESIPNIDNATAQRVISIIEGNREALKIEQALLATIVLQNNNIVDTFPNSLFCSGHLEAEIISSTRTKGAMGGVDDLL